MTGQISDTMIYKGEECYLLEPRRKTLFDAPKVGIIPQIESTACRDGYYCTFEISNNKLLLRQVNLLSINDNLPRLDSVNPSEENGRSRYNNLALLLTYSGKMFLGTKLLNNHPLFAGHRLPTHFQSVYAIELENGKVTQVREISDKASLLTLQRNLRPDNGIGDKKPS